MPDIIQLLPDSVANQIAAGEVVQRPASAVKELLENAIDAGSTKIKLVIKDAGKTLLQVIDNGCGMSETDARMSFERHATSKIRKADDLFSIRTMGFRGEALASIAAIAQVELKTRRHDDQLGTQIIMEGSEFKGQEPCSSGAGTSFLVKNLFYNIPARRNFLKTDPVELRHIIDEFQRAVLPHPEIAFEFHNNSSEVYHLESGSFKQRIMGIYGSSYNSRLVPVEEDTQIVKVGGFIGTPEHARKTRGEQFFFVNKRFIKSAYLQHAVQAAYSNLLPADSFPSFFLMLEVDPSTIDINIHPTKTEIKFEDEKSIYAIIRSAVRQSLGKYNIAPSIDFEQEMSLYNIPAKPAESFIEAPKIKVDPHYNPFDVEKPKLQSYKAPEPSALETSNRNNWEKLYSRHTNDQLDIPAQPEQKEIQQTIHPDWEKDKQEGGQKVLYQLHNRYILSHIKSGFMIIDQQGAHERILYERFIASLEKHQGNSQQELFPQTAELSAGDMELVKELKEDIVALGFDIRDFGNNTIVIHGTPAEAGEGNSATLLEKLLEGYKQNLLELKNNKHENLARAMAKNAAVKPGKLLSAQEMNALVDELFACQMPYSTPGGKPTITTITIEELDRRFKK